MPLVGTEVASVSVPALEEEVSSDQLFDLLVHRARGEARLAHQLTDVVLARRVQERPCEDGAPGGGSEEQVGGHLVYGIDIRLYVKSIQGPAMRPLKKLTERRQRG